MQVTGGFIIFALLAAFIIRLGGDIKQHLNTSFGGRASISETMTPSSPSERPSPVAFNGDAAAIAQAMDAVKPIATGKVIRHGRVVGTKVTEEDRNRAAQEKIRIVAPLVLSALTECPKPIKPEQMTSHLENETDFCPGVPVKECPPSSAGARTPMQLMPATIKQFAKAGENPETLLDSLKIAVRHLCFARGKGNVELDPSSDAAILRYNASTDYLNAIRATQAKHAPTWASLKSSGVPVLANTASSGNSQAFAANPAAPIPVPAGCERLLRGGVYCPGAAPKPHYMKGSIVTEPATWFSSWGDRRNHGGTIVGHGGIDAGCSATGKPFKSPCDGKVLVATVGNDGLAGKMIAIDCGNEKVTVAHLDSIAVTVGQTVTAEQLIGGCGHTGNAEPKPGTAAAPHAHIQLAIRQGNGWKNVNPCAAPEGFLSLHCDPYIIGPQTRLNPIRDVGVGPIASN